MGRNIWEYNVLDKFKLEFLGRRRIDKHSSARLRRTRKETRTERKSLLCRLGKSSSNHISYLCTLLGELFRRQWSWSRWCPRDSIKKGWYYQMPRSDRYPNVLLYLRNRCHFLRYWKKSLWYLRWRKSS